jgi:hypothetical protein
MSWLLDAEVLSQPAKQQPGVKVFNPFKELS